MRPSSKNRALASSSSRRWGSTRLSATSRPMPSGASWRATKTWPIPPAPSGSKSSYLPTLARGLKPSVTASSSSFCGAERPSASARKPRRALSSCSPMASTRHIS
ncbi:MAG: hypothetical protein QM765_42480 [Myxococcales bacterium]